MVVVIKKKGETTDKLLKRFTKTVREENIAFDVNKNMFHKSDKELKKDKMREKAKMKKQGYYKPY